MVGWLWFAPPPPLCRVRVVDMPVAQLRHHRLRVAGRSLPATGLVDVPVGAREVVLVGPRYAGELKLPPDCGETVVLEATPLPARLKLQGLPPRAVVSCRNCPGIDPEANYLPTHLPPMAMSEPRASVKLWVRAPGFQSVKFATTLYPGENIVHIPMQLRRNSR